MPIKRRRVVDSFNPNKSDPEDDNFPPPPPPPPRRATKTRKVTSTPITKSPPKPSPKPASPDQPPPRPRNPPPGSPLWVHVQHTMDQEQYLRHMCKSMQIELKKHKLDLAKYKDELSARDETIAAHKSTTNDLRQQLTAERAHVESLHKQLGETDNKWQRKLDHSTLESKRYRTALAAAFKLVDDLQARTTLAELLEVTDRQLASGSPAKPATIKKELALDYGSPRQLAVPCTPVKRERLCGEDAESSDDEPLAKTRRSRQGSCRRVVKDEDE